MSRSGGKLLLFLFVLAFGIFYGISLTSDGIEEIHGPLGDVTESTIEDTNAADSPSKHTMKTTQEDIGTQNEQLSGAEIKPVSPASHSLLTKLLDKLGSLLNLLADRLIRLIVKLGEAILS